MSFHQVSGGVEAQENLFFLGFPGQGLEGKINRERWIFDHQRRTTLRIAEDQKFHWPHGNTGGLRFGSLVQANEYLNLFCPEQVFQAINRLRHRISTLQALESVRLHDASTFSTC